MTGVGEAKDDMYKSVVRLTLVEANEKELRYRRKGKDATAVFDVARTSDLPERQRHRQ